MKGNKLIILVAILVVAVGVIILNEKLGNKKPTEKEQKFFPEMTEQTIGKIIISEGETSIQLKRKGDVWVVSKPSADAAEKPASTPLGAENAPATAETAVEYTVDSASITAAVEKIASLKKDALISENPEKQSIFEVDSVKGLNITVADNSGKKIGSFIIGKSGPDYNSNYIRLKGSNDVYMSSGGVRYSLFTDLNRWRDKTILRFDKTTAKGITLTSKDGSMITLAHADSGNPWQIIEPIQNPAKTETVNGIIEKLASLSATDFQDEALADTATGFDSPELGVTVSFNNGSSRNIIFGKKNSDNKYWVKTDGKDQVFLIGEYTVNQVNKTLDDLKGEPEVKPVKADSVK
ncbi:MAG: DUF4340 domain-containing protein [Chitinispirillaceae bacterium]|nr:DUF4340 domain-containing protein [Chitinispirillaceae bacterium]